MSISSYTCTLIGHEVASLAAKSKTEFRNLCRFISDIDADHGRSSRKLAPLCVHIAAHGNEDGLGFGKDLVTWDELFDFSNRCVRWKTTKASLSW
jgi:hypothetical protein